jgi:hypothetical protein
LRECAARCGLWSRCVNRHCCRTIHSLRQPVPLCPIGGPPSLCPALLYPHAPLRQVHLVLADVLRLAAEPKAKFVDLCVAVAKLVGVLVEHVALDPAHPKTPKDSKHLRAYCLALIDAVEAFAALDVTLKVTTRYIARDEYSYSYLTKEFIGAAARLGTLVCARSGRAGGLGRLFTTVVDATVEYKTRCVLTLLHSGCGAVRCGVV